MQLSYRGSNYNKSTKSTQVVTKQVLGKYRGIDFTSRPSEQAIAVPTTRKLKYRGLAY